MKRKLNAIVIFLCIPLAFAVLGDGLYSSKKIHGIVSEVLDGDTIIVQGHSIRLYGLDAPELDQNSFDGVKIGIMSRDFLKNLIEGKEVTVEYSKRGYYGRIIGTVMFRGTNINLLILSSGMGIFSRYSKRKDYYLAGFHARMKRKGIFKTKGFLNPSEFRRKKRP